MATKKKVPVDRCLFQMPAPRINREGTYSSCNHESKARYITWGFLHPGKMRVTGDCPYKTPEECKNNCEEYHAWCRWITHSWEKKAKIAEKTLAMWRDIEEPPGHLYRLGVKTSRGYPLQSAEDLRTIGYPTGINS